MLEHVSCTTPGLYLTGEWALPVEQADAPAQPFPGIVADSAKEDFKNTQHPVADMIICYSTVPG